MYIEIVVFYLASSLLLYCLFAGADFGAGIVQAFIGPNKKEIIARAIGPVWEANHVWIILVVVILLVGFPEVYSQLCVTFHIPITLMLIGIIMRGCAFTFGHYDAVKDQSQKWYNLIFIVSSFITPFMLGTIAGAVFLGHSATLNEGFIANYILPWMNLFSFSVGAFTCTLFAFLASVYLIGEAEDRAAKTLFVKKAKQFNFSAILFGGLVFLSAKLESHPVANLFINSKVCLTCLFLMSLLVISLWLLINRGYYQLARINAASQVALILIGWFGMQYPRLIMSREGPLTVYNSAAPTGSLVPLTYSLTVGAFFVFPALIYLLKIFKMRTSS